MHSDFSLNYLVEPSKNRHDMTDMIDMGQAGRRWAVETEVVLRTGT